MKHRDSQKAANVPDEPWAMDALQREFERLIQESEADDKRKLLSSKQAAGIAEGTAKKAGRLFYKSLIELAPEMLSEIREKQARFERRNFRRWRKAFDLIETIWVSCEELGRNFNQHYRLEAVKERDYVFEAMTHLHAKALLVTSEIICLLKGGFADGALTRWRTLYEINVVATLLRREGQELAHRYLACSRVQAWNEAKDDDNGDDNDEEHRLLRAQAKDAIETYGDDIKRRNGWACTLTKQKSPTFEKLVELAGMSDDKSLYKLASLHIHGNHRAADELLGVCENQEVVLLVGASNSGMVGPLTLASLSLVELTTLLLLTKPNMDRLAFVNTIWRMARRMHELSTRVERRTLEAARKRKTS